MSDTLSIPYGDPTDSPDTETESGYGDGKGNREKNENEKRDFETAALEGGSGGVGAEVSSEAPSALEALGRANSQVEKTETAFDWFHDEEVIIERQQSVAVYRNGREHIVIRGESADGSLDEDAFVIVSTALALQRLIDALLAEKKKGGLK